jgi:arginine N-succinyltransferase
LRTTVVRPGILLRPATLRDLRPLSSLAKRLDTVNLPSDPTALRGMVQRSVRSFAGRVRNRADAVYVFVAEDTAARRIAGASVIVAKHGTPEWPHYYLEMAEEERYSRSLRKLFRHTYLHLRRSFDGPTEVGGLIVDPDYRGRREQIGKQLSFVRFLYMGVHRRRFERSVLAEMLPPLTATGDSPLWECYGRRVTGLSFHEADLLCRADKEFIEALFPESPIYVCMLPESVRDQLGVVGPGSAAALHALEKIGFRFLGHVDPFDGGPYYGAVLDEVTLVRELVRYRVRVVDTAHDGVGEGSCDLLVGVETTAGLRAVRVHAGPHGRELRLSRSDAKRLGVATGRRVAAVPFP